MRVVNEIKKIIDIYCKELVPSKQFHAVKKSNRLNGRNLKIGPITIAQMFMEQYMIQMHLKEKKIYTIDQKLTILKNVTIEQVREIYKDVLQWNKALVVYQSRKKLPLKLSNLHH